MRAGAGAQEAPVDRAAAQRASCCRTQSWGGRATHSLLRPPLHSQALPAALSLLAVPPPAPRPGRVFQSPQATPPVSAVGGGPPAWLWALHSQIQLPLEVQPAQGQGLVTASRVRDATGSCSSKSVPTASCWVGEGKGMHSTPPDSQTVDRGQEAKARSPPLRLSVFSSAKWA